MFRCNTIILIAIHPMSTSSTHPFGRRRRPRCGNAHATRGTRRPREGHQMVGEASRHRRHPAVVGCRQHPPRVAQAHGYITQVQTSKSKLRLCYVPKHCFMQVQVKPQLAMRGQLLIHGASAASSGDRGGCLGIFTGKKSLANRCLCSVACLSTRFQRLNEQPINPVGPKLSPPQSRSRIDPVQCVRE